MNLLKSNHTRYLEGELARVRLEKDGELARVRMEKDARIRELVAEKLELLQKIEKLELALIPGLRNLTGQKPSRPSFEPTKFQEALDAHNRVEFGGEQWQTTASSRKNSGPADVEKSTES